MYFNPGVLKLTATAVGKPIRVDTNTQNVERGCFARVCMEIDLSQPVVGKVWIWDNWYKVQYEGLHMICTTCGCYGHYSHDCKGGFNSMMQKETGKPTIITTESEVVRKRYNKPKIASKSVCCDPRGYDNPLNTRGSFAHKQCKSNSHEHARDKQSAHQKRPRNEDLASLVNTGEKLVCDVNDVELVGEAVRSKNPPKNKAKGSKNKHRPRYIGAGMYTMMLVRMVSPNHLQFIEDSDSEPPEDNARRPSRGDCSVLLIINEENMEVVPETQGTMMKEDEGHDIVMGGAASKDAKRFLREMISRHHPSVFVVYETHIPFDRVKMFWSKLVYSQIAIEEAIGNLGGIWLLSTNCSFSFSIVTQHHQVVTIRVALGENSWILYVVYVSPTPSARVLLWDDLI
ncbi:PREDICTED: uncharacterized protein LOC109359804 [Lupinus angustifolius]|uniref:uncharacterized protein LOC109359804 n=1 Tax=Lupinus angustifolius TaxID=3871 RepID=UPI00092E6771|nr:PREDICTED: uncharacterized protein LOC109359804 [Lupinus angustifolius]